MNLKQLEVFVAVAESGSFSRGAEAAFITQSTVSQHIAALESELGTRLLDRTGKGALLTEGGKILLRHARQILADTHETENAMRRFRGLEEASLTVGGSNIPGDYMIPEILPLFVQRYPGVRLTLLQGDSRDILEKIARETTEIGVIGSRFDDEGFAFVPLGQDEIKVIAGPEHPLRLRQPVSLRELARHELIMREPGSGTARTVAEALAKVGLDFSKLNVRACLGSNEAVKHAVGRGLGISFLSEISVRRELARNELVELHVEELEISRRFYLVSRAGRELSPAARAFAGLMQEMYG